MPLDVLSALVVPPARDASRPALTYLDPATGERTELSGRALALWVSKTANLVRDELGLAPGDVVALRLPAHWQAWSWLFGAWLAGVTVDLADRGSAVPDDAAAVVVTAQDARTAVHGPRAGVADWLSLALRPLALPGDPPPSDVIDYDAHVRGHGDRYTATVPGAGAFRVGASTRPWTDALDGPATGAPGGRLLTSLAPSGAGAVRAVCSALAAGRGVVLLGSRPTPSDAEALAAEGATDTTDEIADLLR